MRSESKMQLSLLYQKPTQTQLIEDGLKLLSLQKMFIEQKSTGKISKKKKKKNDDTQVDAMVFSEDSEEEKRSPLCFLEHSDTTSQSKTSSDVRNLSSFEAQRFSDLTQQQEMIKDSPCPFLSNSK